MCCVSVQYIKNIGGTKPAIYKDLLYWALIYCIIIYTLQQCTGLGVLLFNSPVYLAHPLRN